MFYFESANLFCISLYNKKIENQGQSLQDCGINFEVSLFRAWTIICISRSRIEKPSSLRINAPQKNTKQLVYQKGDQVCFYLMYLYKCVVFILIISKLWLITERN